MKLKFQILSNPINLHHRDDIYYVVMASILIHNMLVEAQVGKDEVVNGSMYDIVDVGAVDTENEAGDDGDDNSIHSGDCLIDRAVVVGVWDKSTKFEMVHKRWEALYDFEGLAQLKDAMKKHLCKIHKYFLQKKM